MNSEIITGPFNRSLLLSLGGPPRPLPARVLQIDKAWRFAITRCFETNVSDGLEIIAALNSLPFAEPMRCHIPVFGLELLLDETQVFACSICWQCNNLFTLSNGERGGLTFDGESPEAQQLLERFRAALNQTD